MQLGHDDVRALDRRVHVRLRAGHAAAASASGDYDSASDDRSASDDHSASDDCSASDDHSAGDNGSSNNAASDDCSDSSAPADGDLSAERLRRSSLANGLLLRRRLPERWIGSLRSRSDGAQHSRRSEAEQQHRTKHRDRGGCRYRTLPSGEVGVVSFRWLGAPTCPQDAVCASGQYWDGMKCSSSASLICAPFYVRSPVTGCCEAVGQVSLHNKHFYRGRWLIGRDPATQSCEQIRDFLNASFASAQANNRNWPWDALKVFLEPFQTWPSSRTGVPYATENYCLLYVQGQWVQAETKQDALKLSSFLAPNTRPIDFWDDTDDPLAQKLLYDFSEPGWGCGPGAELRFDPATGASQCVRSSVPAPAPGTTITAPKPAAKKSSNVPLYAALGALAIGAVYIASRGIS